MAHSAQSRRDAQKQFKRHTRSHRFAGGDIFVARPSHDRPGIMYVATQADMYRASLTFVNRGLRKLAKYCAEHAVATVALPKIGAGLGKLDWGDDVKPLMLRHLASGSTIFRVYENFQIDDEE